MKLRGLDISKEELENVFGVSPEAAKEISEKGAKNKKKFFDKCEKVSTDLRTCMRSQEMFQDAQKLLKKKKCK